MPIRNLHTLLNRPWYIDMAYAESHLPLLFNMLEGKSIDGNSEKETPVTSFRNEEGAALSFNGSPGETENKVVAVIDIKSPIYKYDQNCGPTGTQSKIAAMDRLKNNDSVAGVVLDIDSGGGQAYGTPEFYDYIRNYPKPVVTYTGGIMASAGYYIGSAASHVIANKRSEAIGSIGAYTQMLDLSGYYEKQGAKIHTIYADKSTEKNKAYREALKGDYKAYIKEELNPLVDDFIADIKAARAGVSEDVFKGATYPGPAALQKGLVDQLGTLQDAVNKVFELSKEKQSTNTKIMSTPNSFPNLEATLGLDAPLASTDNGSYLNEDQKAAIENKLSANATALKTAQDAQATAEAALQTAKEEHATELQAATGVSDNLTEQLRAAATLAGVEGLADDASAEDISTALTARIEELNARPGATHTSTASNDKDPGEYSHIDFNSSIYKNR